MRLDFDEKLKNLRDIPYTISYIIKKYSQVENLNELPKEKRPTDQILWDGTSEELEAWLDKVLNRKKKSSNLDDEVVLDIREIEG